MLKIKNKKIVVTGGAGFIGSHLVDFLAEDNFVLVIDNFTSGKKENLYSHLHNENVRIVEADIRDKDSMVELTKGMDWIYHLAVQCLRVSIGDPRLVHDVNATGTLNLCIAAQKNEVERFIYISSSEVYGTAQKIPMDEIHPLEPTTPYGASKLAGEKYISAFHITYGLPAIIIRPFNTYGPRAHFEGAYGEVIPRFAVRALNNLPPIVFGDGLQTRDFTFISDTVKGVILASTSDNLLGDVVNIASGSEIHIKGIAHIILESLGKENLEVVYKSSRPGDVRRLFADITKAKKDIGFQPQVGIKEGIQSYIEWVRTQTADLAAIPEVNWGLNVGA